METVGFAIACVALGVSLGTNLQRYLQDRREERLSRRTMTPVPTPDEIMVQINKMTASISESVPQHGDQP